jgi:hypothetical protein
MARERVLRRISAEAPRTPADRSPSKRAWRPAWASIDPRRRALAAGLLAASLMLVTFVSLFWGLEKAGRNPGRAAAFQTDPLLAKLFDNDMRLATARTPRARLEILADMADDLQTHARSSASVVSAEQLGKLVALYERLLDDGVVPAAMRIPFDERQQVLTPIARRLERIGSESLAMTHDLPEESSRVLHVIASSSRRVDDELRALARERKL